MLIGLFALVFAGICFITFICCCLFPATTEKQNKIDYVSIYSKLNPKEL